MTVYRVFDVTPEGEEFERSESVELRGEDLISELQKMKLLSRRVSRARIRARHDHGSWFFDIRDIPGEPSGFQCVLKLMEKQGKRSQKSFKSTPFDLESVVKKAADSLSKKCDSHGGLLVVVAVVVEGSSQCCVLEAPELEGGPSSDGLIRAVEKSVRDHLDQVPSLTQIPKGEVC